MCGLEELTLDRRAQRIGARTERIAVADGFERGEGVLQSSAGIKPVRSSKRCLSRCRERERLGDQLRRGKRYR
jgi:hypothetical protein